MSAAAAPGPTGPGLNVRAVFDNIVSEVLDYEGPCPDAWPPASGAFPQDGYCNYADAPQKFRLAPGLCQQLPRNEHHPRDHAARVERDVPVEDRLPADLRRHHPGAAAAGLPGSTAASRPAGTPAASVLRAESPLRPAKSALYILFDKSSGMRDFLGSQALATILGLSLTNPGVPADPGRASCTRLRAAGGLRDTAQAPTAANTNEFALDIAPDWRGRGPAEGDRAVRVLGARPGRHRQQLAQPGDDRRRARSRATLGG